MVTNVMYNTKEFWKQMPPIIGKTKDKSSVNNELIDGIEQSTMY